MQEKKIVGALEKTQGDPPIFFSLPFIYLYHLLKFEIYLTGHLTRKMGVHTVPAPRLLRLLLKTRTEGGFCSRAVLRRAILPDRHRLLLVFVSWLVFSVALGFLLTKNAKQKTVVGSTSHHHHPSGNLYPPSSCITPSSPNLHSFPLELKHPMGETDPPELARHRPQLPRPSSLRHRPNAASPSSSSFTTTTPSSSSDPPPPPTALQPGPRPRRPHRSPLPARPPPSVRARPSLHRRPTPKHRTTPTPHPHQHQPPLRRTTTTDPRTEQ